MPKDEGNLLVWSENAQEILATIISDVEEMASGRPEGYESEERDEQEHWFGEFSVGFVTPQGGAYIQWPNLGLLIKEAKQVLKKEDVSHRATKTRRNH